MATLSLMALEHLFETHRIVFWYDETKASLSLKLLPTQGKPLDSMEAFEAYLEGIRERGIEILQQGGRIII